MDQSLWQNMFTLVIPVLEKILRPIIVYIALVVGLRLAGKRELAQMNTFDLVVLLTLSNTVQNAIIGNDNSVTGGLIGAGTLLAMNFLVVRFVYSNRKVEKVVEGEEDVLISRGKINLKALKNEVITPAELEIAAHKQGFASLEEVEKAILEPDGSLSFIGKQLEPDLVRHKELMLRLDQISAQLATLREAQSRPSAQPGAG